MVRSPCCEKIGLKKGKWTEEEDEILINYIQANGEGSWRSLPKNAGTFIYVFQFFLKILIITNLTNIHNEKYLHVLII